MADERTIDSLTDGDNGKFVEIEGGRVVRFGPVIGELPDDGPVKGILTEARHGRSATYVNLWPRSSMNRNRWMMYAHDTPCRVTDTAR